MAGKRVALGHKGTGNARRANAGMGGGRAVRGTSTRNAPPGIGLPTPHSIGSNGMRQYQPGFSFTAKSSPKS